MPGVKHMQTLDRIQDKIGTFFGVGAAPDTGSKTATITSDMPAIEIADATNYVRLQVWADFGAGPKWMATGPEWHGGPGQTAPTLSWSFSTANPPNSVYGVLENGTRGGGSAAVCGLTISFS